MSNDKAKKCQHGWVEDSPNCIYCGKSRVGVFNGRISDLKTSGTGIASEKNCNHIGTNKANDQFGRKWCCKCSQVLDPIPQVETKAWDVVESGGRTHVVPFDDDQEHDLGVWCKCEPHEDTVQPQMLIHNAFDWRLR